MGFFAPWILFGLAAGALSYLGIREKKAHERKASKHENPL
jgi:hypothetical protein